jgi:two-component system, LytTR family, sensor kinase
MMAQSTYAASPRDRGGIRPVQPAGDEPESRRERRYWFTAWCTGWSVFVIITLVDVGVQRSGSGASFFGTPREIAALLAAGVLPGALLSLGAVAAFRWFFRKERRLTAAATWYAATGLAFAFGWAFSNAVILHAGSAVVGPGPAGFHVELMKSMAGWSFLSIIIFAAIVGLFETRRSFDRVRQQELRAARMHSELARARGAALSAQLDPHFLFNTLHVASGLMNENVAAARKVLFDLRDLLEESSTYRAGQWVRLDHEIRFLERYLRILQVRFRDRLQIRFSLDERLGSVLVPPLLLQPLVENAVQHGIARSRTGGWIEIRACRMDGSVRLEVLNSAPSGPRAGSLRPGGGIGIAGVRARLELMFGREASLEHGHLPSGDFRARLAIPWTDADGALERGPRRGGASGGAVSAPSSGEGGPDHGALAPHP